MDKKKIDYEKLNETITLSNKILKIFYVIVIIGVILIAFVLGKVSGIFKMIGNVLAVCAPFFIGLIFAWLLDPIVSWMEKHKIKRTLATVFVFFAFLVFLILICSLIGPMLINQINEFAKMIPSLFLEVSDFIHNMFSKFSSLGLDMSGVESGIYDTIENIGISLTNSLPTAIVNFLSSTISSVGTFLLGLVVGFYLLLDFDNVCSFNYFIYWIFFD